MSSIDWAIVVLYFVAVFAVAIVMTRRAATRSTAAGYFLGGRNSGWFVIGASLFASNIGSEHLVGLAGTAAASGVAVAQFELLACFILLLLGWLFVPFYLRSGVFTMPEFLERRYGPVARWYLAVISVAGYVLTKISVTIAAGGIVFEALMGIDFWTGAFIVVVATGAYTVFGGLRAVLYTDLLQMFVLLGGAIAVTLIGLDAIGGWEQVYANAAPGFMSLWRPMSDPDFPWTGILLGAPILGVWYWCTDQFIVQRVLSAHDIDNARRGTIFGAFLKILPLFIFVLPGVIAYSLAQQGQLVLDRPDNALPAMVATLLPSGLRGIVVAGLLAALMSSLSSVFNSCSTLITWDIYRKLHPQAGERTLVWVGQLSTALLVVLGLLWIPMIKLISGQIYQYLQSVQAYISPPIAAVFLLGIFWRRVNSAGAVAALAGGFVLGIGRLVAELNKSALPDGPLQWFAGINFLHFALLLFAICALLMIVVSLLTRAPDDARLTGLTFQTLPGDAADSGSEGMEPLRSDPAWRRADRLFSVLVILAVAAIWYYFRS
ncbi:MAG: sodium transporter [Gammaproteobacteria bacterium]|nr:MAG: sodium transporter [Gammaproteobacteria bacterium]